MNPEISAVICTYNRAKYLKKALNSVLEQNLAADKYEIIVVDNNSTDNTKAVVDECSLASGRGITCISEPMQGLSFARNAATQAAKSPIVAFIDDDAQADSNWLAAHLEAYSMFPDAVSAGGKMLLSWESEKPAWLSDTEFERTLGFFDYGDVITDMHHPDYPRGSNFSFKKDIFNAVGGFNTSLGRKGPGFFLYGEELEFGSRISKLHLRQIYTPRAVIYHTVIPNHLNKRYLIKRYYGQGKGSIIAGMPGQNGATAVCRHLASNIFRLCLAIIRRNNTFIWQCRICYHGGQLIQILRSSANK
ncbi:MAG: hypothetical protein A2293_15445 [Elusimicrobia bacterium RIFOXYB2_FULL_49_7]|nr:MAG: hypothetical protein A2293_15445 [Elusimicrobia bacterium RIFOXYB2_FULL_49_7]